MEEFFTTLEPENEEKRKKKREAFNSPELKLREISKNTEKLDTLRNNFTSSEPKITEKYVISAFIESKRKRKKNESKEGNNFFKTRFWLGPTSSLKKNNKTQLLKIEQLIYNCLINFKKIDNI